MKNYIKYIGIIAVLFGIYSSKFIVAKHGEDSRSLIVYGALFISLLGLAGIIYTKKYFAAIACISMIIPLIVITIGTYLNNPNLSGIGLILLFILIPIMIKTLSKYENDSKS